MGCLERFRLGPPDRLFAVVFLGGRASSGVSTSVASAIERAEVTRSGERRDLRDAGEVQSIAARLGVSVVVVGVVDSNGQLHVRLIQEGRVQGEIQRSGFEAKLQPN